MNKLKSQYKTQPYLDVLLYFCIAFLFTTCSSSQSANYFSNTGSKVPISKFNPSYSLVQTSSDSVVLFYEIAVNEILFTSIERQGFTANIKFHWKLYSSYEGGPLLAQDSLISIIPKPNEGITHLYGQLKISTPQTDAFIALKTSDLNRRSVNLYTQEIYRESDLKYAQYFQIMRDDNTPLINPFCEKAEIIKVFAPRQENKKLFVYEIAPNDEPGLPPYSTQNKYLNHNLKNIRIILKDTVLNEYRFKMNPIKVSLLVADTTNPTGKSVYQFPSSYPKINSYTELIKPLSYLCTKTEYAQLLTSLNKRESFELFWEKLSGNKERAKTLIKYYYKRVEKANTYFTSYKEGWRTDRGMIIIIFGEPENVKTNSKYETWTYGKGENTATLSFTFEKIPNRLSNNDYILIRNPNYRNIWNSAISTWRGGRYFIF